jgi:hypothetical protein
MKEVLGAYHTSYNINIKMAKESWFSSWKGQKLFSPQHSDWLYSPYSLLVNGHQGLFPRKKAVRL